MKTISIHITDDGQAQYYIAGDIPLLQASDLCRGVARAMERDALRAEMEAKAVESEPE
jgi:hypothetical protein